MNLFLYMANAISAVLSLTSVIFSVKHGEAGVAVTGCWLLFLFASNTEVFLSRAGKD